ncbi:V-type proton ATPase subunit e 1 [Galendromus occidentalis]|uniref:V-type proton ATPase subunit e 1 n=1 Tax=Galendromus occidentalis TaxID=34638 RepID=A0AAJ6QTR2_9ACAR|nr:V-type proton ATPase subunit e 1 [Galendromus occidentalis]
MVSAVIPFLFFTVFWGIIGFVVPILIPRSDNRALIQTLVMLTAACCYLFWLCVWLSQLNPLIGPILSKDVIWMITEYW